jgi:hypothetical protein
MQLTTVPALHSQKLVALAVRPSTSAPSASAAACMPAVLAQVAALWMPYCAPARAALVIAMLAAVEFVAFVLVLLLVVAADYGRIFAARPRWRRAEAGGRKARMRMAYSASTAPVNTGGTGKFMSTVAEPLMLSVRATIIVLIRIEALPPV